MNAVIKTGGKQYRVKEGDLLKVESLLSEVGSEMIFDQVLFLGDGDNLISGTPLVANATVKAEVIAHGRHKKIRVIKFRRRKHHMKQMGHRQNFTEIKITAISR